METGEAGSSQTADDKEKSSDGVEMSQIVLSQEQSGPSTGSEANDATAAQTAPDDVSCGPSQSNSRTPIVTSSSSASLCRICQIGNTESSEALTECRCGCKGHLSRVHRSCLLEWVRHKGSNRCEICDGTFSDVPAPRAQLGVNEREALETLAWHLNRFRPLNRRKRAVLGSVIMFLVLVTCVTSILTVSADREFQEANANPWLPKQALERAHLVFSISVSFLFFSGTLTIGLLLLWAVVECFYSIQRRRILERATARIIAARET